MSVADSITSFKQFEGDTDLRVSLGPVRGVQEKTRQDGSVYDIDNVDTDKCYDNYESSCRGENCSSHDNDGDDQDDSD